jgi:hypothetical protein
MNFNLYEQIGDAGRDLQGDTVLDLKTPQGDTGRDLETQGETGLERTQTGEQARDFII